MKPKVAFYWCASCGGCEEAVVDLAEDVLAVVEAVDIVFWPVALDFKRSDVEALADGELAASFINGAIRTSEQQEMAELLRRKSGAVVAFGSCAWLGGIPGLANLYSREEILERVYREVPSLANDEGTMPGEDTDVQEGHLALPAFSDSVRTLDQVVDVDYYLPGCPPPVHLIRVGGDGARRGDAAGEGNGARARRGVVLGVPARGDEAAEAADQGVQAAPRDGGRPRPVPPRPGPDVPRAGDAGRLRQRLHRREHALHGLHGPDQPGASTTARRRCRRSRR